MRRRNLWLVTAAVAASYAFALACGGDDSTGAGGDDAGTDGTAAVDSTTGDDGSTADTGTSDTGTKDTGAKDTGAGDAADGGSSDAADAAQDVTIVGDSGIVTDAGPGGDAAVLSCGAAGCSLPSNTCCVYPVEMTSSYYLGCSNGNTCPTLVDAGFDAGPAVLLQCASQANCPSNNVCCISSADGGATEAHCLNQTACVSVDGGTTRAQLCDQSMADAGCGSLGSCSSTNVGSWGLPSGFSTCGGVAR